MIIDAPVVHPLSVELRAFTAYTLLGEIKHLEEVIKNSMDRKKEIEEVLKLMNMLRSPPLHHPLLYQLLMIKLPLLCLIRLKIYFPSRLLLHYMNTYFFKSVIL